MGDPKRITRKYSTPNHPWQKERIDEEKEILKAYGMKNKKEIWKMDSVLKKFKHMTKNLIPRRDAQAELEERQMMEKLRALGLVNESSTLEDVLGLGLKDICERRLQTVVVKKKLARSARQARQLITHNHIIINGIKVTSPAYLVRIDEEGKVSFASGSSFKDENHPERFPMESPDVAANPIIRKKRKAEEKAVNEISAVHHDAAVAKEKSQKEHKVDVNAPVKQEEAKQ